VNLLPNITGTIANWPMQSNLLDTSGNGLNLMTVGWGTPGTAIVQGGTEQYATLTGGLSSFLFNGTTKLVAPSSSLLRLTGAYTFQFLLNLATGIGGFQVYACCADPTRFGGGGGDANAASSLFAFGWAVNSLGTCPYYYDQFHYGGLNTSDDIFPPTVDRFAPPTAWGITETHLITFRHNADNTMDSFFDSTKRPGTMAVNGQNVSGGNERFWIGGCDSTFNNVLSSGTKVAGIRVVNYARTDAQITADVAGASTPPLGTGLAAPAVTAELYRYAPAAYGDRFYNPGER
jgi:hypothetical protein